MTFKVTLALLAALPLAACNMVVAETPWFDAASGPQLKDGLWANLQTPDCKLDAAVPIADWPSCASPMLITGNSYSGPPNGPRGKDAESSNWQAIPHVLVGGDPQLDQLRLEPNATGGQAGPRTDKPLYLYMAVKPVALDADGRIIETQRWPVLCGPMPKKPREKDGVPIFTSDRPFKGIRVDGEICLAESAEALRAAAAASEVAAQEGGFTKVTSRWIRGAVN
jgi:hypothetical protein